jgi:hypothetical protein
VSPTSSVQLNLTGLLLRNVTAMKFDTARERCNEENSTISTPGRSFKCWFKEHNDREKLILYIDLVIQGTTTDSQVFAPSQLLLSMIRPVSRRLLLLAFLYLFPVIDFHHRPKETP